MMKRYVAGCILSAAALSANADATSMLSRLVGYTIVQSADITGWRDQDGKQGDSFEGCNYGRVLFLSTNQQITCATYSYLYAYRPTVVIFARSGDLKMLVEGELMDMGR